MGCLCRNFHMLCDRQFQYTLVLLYICVKTHNVHRNKKCSVFHICLFSERCDFYDLDIGCSSVSTNFVNHRRRFHWIIKRKPNIHVLTKGGAVALGVGHSFLCRREGVGHVFFINHISKCSGPAPPSYTFWPVPKVLKSVLLSVSLSKTKMASVELSI